MATVGGVYCLIRYPVSNHLRFKNWTARGKSVLANYNGRLVSCKPEVEVLEGSWPGNKTVAMFYFPSESNAKSWLNSDTDVKQPDFMDGIDVVLMDLLETPPGNKNTYILADIIVHNLEAFANEYGPKSSYMKELGTVAVTGACAVPLKLRGMWKPNMLVMNEWTSMEEYHRHHNSEQYQSLKQLREQLSDATVIAL